MRCRARWWAAGAVVMVLAACSSKGTETHASDRGAGLSVASLPASAQASAYEAALRQAFTLGPRLVLLIDPTLLPSARGGKGTQQLAPDVIRRLHAAGVTQGTCEPRATGAGGPPLCATPSAGYVVHVSNIFRVAPDTVQLYVMAERYRPARDSTAYASPLHFEQRYNLARRGDRWVVVSQARLVS